MRVSHEPNRREIEEFLHKNFYIVEAVYYNRIKEQAQITGLTKEDFLQIGSIALLTAKEGYDSTKSTFLTYASAVIRNAMIDQIRLQYRKQKYCSVPDYGFMDFNNNQNFSDNQLSESDISEILDTCCKNKSKTVTYGVEAIKLRVQGYTNVDISEIFNIKQNVVGAWISAASKMLKNNKTFLCSLERNKKIHTN